jgi:peptidoglycan biosynthesis protein MviN/MurJ (putative lipid II flippase)
VVSGVAIAVNIVASVALVRSIGFAGLALGTSLASIANGVALVWLLRRRLGRLDGRRLLMTFAKACAASAVMALAAVAIQSRNGARLAGFGPAAASRSAGCIDWRRAGGAGFHGNAAARG